MSSLLGAVAVAFGVVFVAELGDKTQLLALSFGSRYPLRRVALGLAIGYGTAGLIAVVVGGVLGANLPQRPIEIGGGAVFIAFGLLALRPPDAHSDAGREAERRGDRRPRAIGRSLVRSSVVATVGLTIVLAEMGDKTQIATATLAARADPVGTWIGATAGEVASGMIGAAAGSVVGDRIPTASVRWVSASLFIAFGTAMLAGWP